MNFHQWCGWAEEDANPPDLSVLLNFITGATNLFDEQERHRLFPSRRPEDGQDRGPVLLRRGLGQRRGQNRGVDSPQDILVLGAYRRKDWHCRNYARMVSGEACLAQPIHYSLLVG